jgi:glycopeptide antibiotics resistance protein
MASLNFVLPVLLIICFISLFLRAHQIVIEQLYKGTETVKNQNRQIIGLVFALLVIYLLVYIYLTFLFRKPVKEPSARLLPFQSYREAFQRFPFGIKNQGLATDILRNILLTVPLGLLLPLVFHRKNHPYLVTLLTTFCLAVATEILQLITRLGLCETDDLISSAIGCLVGILFQAVGTWTIKLYISRKKRYSE